MDNEKLLNEEELETVSGGENLHTEFVRGYAEGTDITGNTKKEMKVDITTKNPPFSTYRQKRVDPESRVNKFKKRFGL